MKEFLLGIVSGVVISFLGNFLFDWAKHRRRVKLLVHRGYFKSSKKNPPEEFFFITVTNLSKNIDVVVTHIWFADCEPNISVLAKPLPMRLRYNDEFTTWIPVNEIPPLMYADVDFDEEGEPRFAPHGDTHDEFYYEGFRARLSTEEIITSKENTNIPNQGYVAT